MYESAKPTSFNYKVPRFFLPSKTRSFAIPVNPLEDGVLGLQEPSDTRTQEWRMVAQGWETVQCQIRILLMLVVHY